MTIKELRDLLEQYPNDAEVFVIQERPEKYAGTMLDVEVSWVIDQDTSKGSLCLWPKQNLVES